MKKAKDHIRCEVLIMRGRYTLVNCVDVDRAYSSEVKMLERMLKKVEVKDERFIADKMYDVIWLEEYLKVRGIEEYEEIQREKKRCMRSEKT